MNLTVLIFVVAASTSVCGSCLRSGASSSSARCKRAPQSDTQDEGSEIVYKLFTPKFSSEGTVVTADNPSLLKDGGFDPLLRTIIIIHGWLSDQRPSFAGFRLKKEIFKKAAVTGEYFNIILVDWSPIDTIWYWTAAKKVPIVGNQNARLLRLIMNTFGYGADKFHIMGHSLGAHIAGETARSLGTTEPLITGLDPAGPSFGPDNRLRLTSKDSRNVLVIYTCAPIASLGDSVGHTNIYPHGGRWIQPGCGFDVPGVCSHCRAYLIQAEIIVNRGLKIQQCPSFSDFQNGLCDGEPLQTIDNIFPMETPKGDFYFWSNPSSPFNNFSQNGIDDEWQHVARREGC